MDDTGPVTVEVRSEPGRERFRQLPPRVTPEQQIPLQAVLHLRQDRQDGEPGTWAVRMGWTG
jgi:hypothetical protein